MAQGVIYVMTTAVNGLIKIGKTEVNQFERRMNFLEGNGYYNVSSLRKAFAIKVDDYDEKEKLLHKIFSKSRVAQSELFSLDKNLVIDLLRAFSGEIIFPAPNANDAAVSMESSSSNRIRPRERFSFERLDIPVGAVLIYTENPTIQVKVADRKNHILYQNDTFTLTALVQKLHGRRENIRGTKFFTYQNEVLSDRYDRLM